MGSHYCPLHYFSNYGVNTGKLTAKQVIAYSKADPKKYSDGEGLYFCVRKQGSPYWMIRYTTAKGRREATLGQFPLMSLADARIAAAYFRKEVRDGGAMKAVERKNADNHLQSAQVVVATGKYVGEGFDLPRLDTLFLAMPIAWKGTLAQYAGRIHRESEGKTQVTIHDYVDCALPMLQRMFKKREKSYKAMGYALEYIDANSNKQPALKLENAPSSNTKSN